MRTPHGPRKPTGVPSSQSDCATLPPAFRVPGGMAVIAAGSGHEIAAPRDRRRGDGLCRRDGRRGHRGRYGARFRFRRCLRRETQTNRQQQHET